MEQIRVLVACLLALGLALTVSLAGQPDSFVSNLVRMLENNFDEKVIKRWLAKQPPLDRPLTADELARLSQAGASRSLLLALIDDSPSAFEPEPTVGPVYGSRDIAVLLGDFMIDAGVVRVSDLDTNVRVDLGPAVGASIRLEDLLGFERNASTFRTAGSFRFKPKRGIEWSFIRLNRTAEWRITEDLELLGLEFEVGASVASRFDQALFKTAYQHLFVNNGRVAAGMSFGLGVFAFNYEVGGEVTVVGLPVVQERVAVSDVVLLPTIGIVIDYAITPRLIFRNKLDFFAFKVVRISDYRGRIWDGTSNLQYFFSRNVSIGGGIVGSSLRVEREEERAWDIQSDLGGLYVFLGFAF